MPSGLARYHRTCHGVGATDYVVDGDRATGTVRTVAHHLAAAGPTGGGTATVWYLPYDDEYRRTTAGWRIARRVEHTVYVAGGGFADMIRSMINAPDRGVPPVFG